MAKLCKPPRSLRSNLKMLLLFYLIGATLNFCLAIECIKSRTQQPTVPRVINLRGPEAAEYDWPASTPHDFGWPPVDSWQVSKAFGYTRMDARSTSYMLEGIEVSGASMNVELMGWPLPALGRVRMHWDRSHPSWTSLADPDPPIRVHWLGVLVNPLLFAGGLWLLLFGYVETRRWYVQKRCSKEETCRSEREIVIEDRGLEFATLESGLVQNPALTESPRSQS